MISVDNLCRSFGDKIALSNVSFDVTKGEVVGLLGPNGAGKTTTINILSTLLAPTSGSATVAGFDVVDEAIQVRRAITLTGQFAAVDEVLTGRENLVMFAQLRGLNRRDAKNRAVQLLADFGLVEAADKRAGTYSGGMRRRLDLAASLVEEVDVLFLDEPTTGLDPRSRADLWNIVRTLQRNGMTIILTTQYLEEADQLADRIIVIDEGTVVASGTPNELKARAGGRSCVVTPVDPTSLGDIERELAGLGDLASDENEGTITVADANPADLIEVASRLEAASIEVGDLALRRPTLDEVFLQLTGTP